MEGLKTKLGKMREQHEAATEREQKANKNIKVLIERISSDEHACNALQRRIKSMKTDLEKVEDMTDEKLDKLERLNENIHKTESIRRKLERKELKEDGTLSYLESRQKSSKIFVEEAEQRCCESLNKLMMAECEAKKVDARILAAERNETCFNRKLIIAGSDVLHLTNSEESKQANCDEYQERIRRLAEKKEKMLLIAESNERKVTQQEKKHYSLKYEISLVTRRGTEIKRELRTMLDEMNTP